MPRCCGRGFIADLIEFARRRRIRAACCPEQFAPCCDPGVSPTQTFNDDFSNIGTWAIGPPPFDQGVWVPDPPTGGRLLGTGAPSTVIVIQPVAGPTINPAIDDFCICAITRLVSPFPTVVPTDDGMFVGLASLFPFAALGVTTNQFGIIGPPRYQISAGFIPVPTSQVIEDQNFHKLTVCRLATDPPNTVRFSYDDGPQEVIAIPVVNFPLQPAIGAVSQATQSAPPDVRVDNYCTQFRSNVPPPEFLSSLAPGGSFFQ